LYESNLKKIDVNMVLNFQVYIPVLQNCIVRYVGGT